MRAPRLAVIAGLVVGVGVGVYLSLSPPVLASRNSSGTYSLPSGNPVVSGATISSTWANNTLGDISTELTSSLDRSGRGAMLAPLQLANGSSTLPALTFGSDPDTGLYRAGAGDIRMQVDATRTQSWTATSVLTSVPLTSQAAFIAQDGGVVTTQGTNAHALTATGTGWGAGAFGTGGSNAGSGVLGQGGGNSGAGVYGIGGTTNGPGVQGLGAGLGAGGTFEGGSSGPGVSGTGGGAGQPGVSGTGAPGGAGTVGIAGTAATSTVRQSALAAHQGDLYFTGVVNPASTVATSNILTPKNFVKAWANLFTDGSGGVSVVDGVNVSGATLVNSFNRDIQVNFASVFSSNTSYACSVVMGVPGPYIMALSGQVAGSINISYWDTSTNSTVRGSFATTSQTVHLVCVGAQ